LRREGRRKRKAGAKNEKAIFIIATLRCEVKKKIKENDKKITGKYRVTILLS
jgi:hypothetical protein